MTPTQIANRLRAAEFLESLEIAPGNEFDMNEVIFQKKCGTSACAIGWIGLSKVFPEFEANLVELGYLLTLSGEPCAFDTVANTLFGHQDTSFAFWWPGTCASMLNPDGGPDDEEFLTPAKVAEAIRLDLAQRGIA